MAKNQEDSDIEHGFGMNIPTIFGPARALWQERYVSGSWVDYDDPLDQARADSMEGGE